MPRFLFIPLLAALLAAPAAAQEPATPAADDAVRVVARGLANPRGFAFAADGGLLVALAGSGGDTAAVVRVGPDGCPAPVAGGFPTGRVVFGGAVGFADVAVLDGSTYALLAGGNIDGGRAPNGLYRLDAEGEPALVADLSTFIRDNPVADVPPDYDTDGQPYRLAPLPDGSGFLVTEGNSNQLIRAGLDGTVSRVADLSQGHPIPTGLALGPNGDIFVGYFTAIPYAEGTAKVVRIDAQGNVSDAWTGLTTVTDIAVGPDGALYATEMATGHGDDPNAIAPGTGRLVRQTGPDAAEPVVTGLDRPVALEFGPDGALYVGGPAYGADGGEGIILRIAPGAEPVAVPGDLPVGGACGS